MTADVELLPLPEGVDVIFSPDGNGAALDVFTAEQVQDYARANVAHATAAKDVEIEALRAEVERLKRLVQKLDNMLGKRPCAGMNADGKPRCLVLAESEARAERLAEALRQIRKTGYTDIGDRMMVDDAMRDHDQEVGNGRLD